MGVYISRFEGRNTGLGPLGSSRTHAAASTAFEAALERHARSQRIGAAERTIYCRNVRQSTDRIARTIFNVAVCRAFLRSVLSVVYRPSGTITDRSRKYSPLIDRLEM
jgi:hypothetical protein